MRRRSSKKLNKESFNFKKLRKDLHWLDAVSQTGWCTKSEMNNTKPMNAVSSEMWVYKSTKEYITLFGTYSYDEKGELEFGEVITIPKMCYK